MDIPCLHEKTLYPNLPFSGYHHFLKHMLKTKILISCDDFFTEKKSLEKINMLQEEKYQRIHNEKHSICEKD